MARTDLGSAIAHIATLINLYKNSDTEDMAKFIERCRRESIFLSYNGSIAKLLSKYIVEPVVICSDKLKTHELTDKINKLHTDIFASFYSQAFQVLTSGHGMEVNVAIDLLSTDTGGFISATSDKVLKVLAQEEHIGGFHADLVSDGKYLNISFGLEAGNSKSNRDDRIAKFNAIENANWDSAKAIDMSSIINNGTANSNNNNNTNNNTNSNGNNNNNKNTNSGSNAGNNVNNTNSSNNNTSTNNNSNNNNNTNNNNNNNTNSNRNNNNNNNTNNNNNNNTNSNRNNNNNNNNNTNSDGTRVGGIRTTSINVAKDEDNLAMSTIFKTFEITISDKNANGKELRSFVIPITIKTYVIFTKVEQILNMIEPRDRKKSFLYRLDEYKSGAIKFRDLIFAGDLIKSYKKNKIKDKDSLLQLISNRNMTSANKAITHSREGFEKFYNMIVLTADEVPLFKRSVGGDIEKPNYKDKFLNMVRGLLFTVVDLDYERISVYIKDLTGKSDISFNGLKRKKDGDFQLSDFLKTMMNNNHPVF